MVTDLKRAVLKAKSFQLLKASKPHSDSSNQLCAGHTSRTSDKYLAAYDEITLNIAHHIFGMYFFNIVCRQGKT